MIKPSAGLAKLDQGETDPEHKVAPEPSPRRVRVEFNGEMIADSTNAFLVHETRHLPVYYFPRGDVRMDLLDRTDHTTHCPYKGDASYWTVRVGERSAENAAWSYESPLDDVAEITDTIAFYFGKMDHWYEEDDEIFVHARDPYSRVDVVNSSRPVRVVLGGEMIAETSAARFLFETGLPTRFYIPREDVRMEFLEPSEKTSDCPYKGTASYYSVRVGGTLYEDVVWTYPDPIPECPKIKDYLCFFNEHVDDIFVDGVPVAKTRTKWSRG